MTTSAPRKFTVGQVMTVLVGGDDRVFCSWGELLDVLGHVLQDVPLADEVAAAIDAARPHVQVQHPALLAFVAPPVGASDAHVLAWLADIEERHGALLELALIADDEDDDEPEEGTP